MTIVPALANSCNTYFLTLSAKVDRTALASICIEYQLRSPAVNATADELIGLRAGWPQEANAVLNAYTRLMQNRSEKTASIVLDGMRQCASTGTAKKLGVRAYAKTGTAPCSHMPAAEGDGYAVVAYPDDIPRLILLAQQHNTTGANTALLAGNLLRGHFGALRAQEQK